jgi:hypothetical protein
MLNTEVEACCAEPLLRQPIVALLPCNDPYLLGYQDRSRYLEMRHLDRTFDQTGNVTSTIVLNGRVIGVWDLIAESCLMKLFLFLAVSDEARAAIETAAQQVGCFTCREEVTLQWCEDMLPLTRQPLGSVVAPLRNC